jgi:hypothetical protein
MAFIILGAYHVQAIVAMLEKYIEKQDLIQDHVLTFLCQWLHNLKVDSPIFANF